MVILVSYAGYLHQMIKDHGINKKKYFEHPVGVTQ